MKKPELPKGSKAKHLAVLTTQILKGLSPLVEHCALTVYDDGTPRQPGWISIKTLGRGWVVELKEPSQCLSLRVLAESLDEALENAALLLCGDDVPWETDSWMRDRKAPKKK